MLGSFRSYPVSTACDDSTGPDRGFQFVRRKPEILQELPLSFRWEFTRRHPYYLLLWQLAHSYRDRDPSVDPQDGYAAYLALGEIGVTGEPQDPSMDFEQLDDARMTRDFLSGAVQPMTLRAQAALLLNMLPPSNLVELGTLMRTIGLQMQEIGEEQSALDTQRRLASVYLSQMVSPALDGLPQAPLYYIHLETSQRQIVADLERQVNHWKSVRGIPQRRRRTEKLDEYLEVWDRREGWRHGHYERARSRPFEQIAIELEEPKQTIVNKYRRAFYWITGHDFSIRNWLHTVALVKFAGIGGRPDSLPNNVLRRLLNPSAPRPVLESVLVDKPVEHGQVGLVEAKSAVADTIVDRDLILDLQDLIARGLSDEAIAEKLELRDAEIVKEFREHVSELAGVEGFDS